VSADRQQEVQGVLLTSDEGRSSGDPTALAQLAVQDFNLFKRSLGTLHLSSVSGRSVLAALLASADPRVRVSTVDAVAEVGGSDAPCDLIARVGQDDDEMVRNAAIGAMAVLRCSGEALLSASTTETSPLVLASLAEAIGALGFMGGRQRLRQLAEHGDAAVRGYAVSSLGLLHSSADRAFLESMVRSERLSRVLAPLHVALYSFDGAFAVQVKLDLRSDDHELVALTLRELSCSAECHVRPPWLSDDAPEFIAAVRSSKIRAEVVAGELTRFERIMYPEAID
jgi:HEAT repeat protein